jgi:hypothetical protein
MEANTLSTSFTEKMRLALKQARQEAEELSLQFALGKADATDKFEEIKKEFAAKARDWNQRYSELKTAGARKAVQLKSGLDDLQVQLTLGKAEARDLFEAQKKKIQIAVDEIESGINSNPEMNERLAELKNEIEKFKLKMELVKLKFELKSFQTKDEFKSAMNDASIAIDKLFDKVEGKWEDAEKKYSGFSDEMTLAYSHLRHAVSKLRGK